MNLKEFLFYSNLSASQFAKKIGISSGHLNRIVNGNLVPSKQMLAYIEKMTDGKVPIEDMFKPINYPDGWEHKKDKIA